MVPELPGVIDPSPLSFPHLPSPNPKNHLVRDDPKLLDDDGEISKSKGRGWRFDSWL